MPIIFLGQHCSNKVTLHVSQVILQSNGKKMNHSIVSFSKFSKETGHGFLCFSKPEQTPQSFCLYQT